MINKQEEFKFFSWKIARVSIIDLPVIHYFKASNYYKKTRIAKRNPVFPHHPYTRNMKFTTFVCK